MTRVLNIVLVGTALALVPITHSPAQAENGAHALSAALILAQGREDGLRERLRERRQDGEERRRRLDSGDSENEVPAEDAAEDSAEVNGAAEDEEQRPRRQRDRAAESEAEERRQRAGQQDDAGERAVREEIVPEAAEEDEEAAPEAAEEPALRERLRDRRQGGSDEESGDHAGEPAVEDPQAAEEPTERERRRDREQPVERAEEPRPETAEPEAVEEPRMRERLRERRERQREATEPRRERAREAQRELEEIAEEQEELREDVRELQRQRAAELEALEREMRERSDGEVVRRTQDRVIIRSGDDRYVVQSNDSRRFMRRAEDVETRRRDGGETETRVRRGDGSQVVTVRNRYGDIVMRSRVGRDGRETRLIDNRRRDDRPRRRVDYYSRVLPPLVITIPRDQYIVETRRASRRDIRRALSAPPVERVEEAWSLYDVLDNERIRDMVPRVDLDAITFEFDSAEVPDDQIDTLEEIGWAIEEIIAENPRELFLLEGHTDWPGSHEYNLALSDRRAENVAIILTEFFDIPPENLITQGYGKQYLKIQTTRKSRVRSCSGFLKNSSGGFSSTISP
jgi:outer membrane protein OmpA-like peptidoglycan-associated protein